MPLVHYHSEVKLSRQEFDRIVKPLSGDSNILAGVGDGFNTPIAVSKITRTQVYLSCSYSRPICGDNDPLYRPHVSTVEGKEVPQALLDELVSRKLAKPWAHFLNPEAIQEHQAYHWISRCVLMTRDDVEKGAKKGIVFVGDSWHAMPIFGGEGGNHAIVDGVELANALSFAGGDLNKAVAKYYDGSFRRCQEAVKRSKQRFYLLHRPMVEWRDLAEKQRR